MSNLATILWTSPSALPRPAGTTQVPSTAFSAASRFRFSALKSGQAWPVAVSLFVVQFQISVDGGATWPYGFGYTDDGNVRSEFGISFTETFVEVDFTTPFDSGLIRGTITIGSQIPASAFTLSCQ